MSADQSDPGGEKKSVPGLKRKARRGRDSAPDAAFDVWLDRGLNSMFGKVADEPIPPELLELIEKSRKGS